MSNYKYAVGVWAFGAVPDRFCEMGYQVPRNFQEKIEAAAKVKGLKGIEIHYNGDFNDHTLEETKKMVEDAGLKVAAVNCEIFGNREFRHGALSASNQAIRKKAVDIIEGAARAAKFLDAPMVNIWPGADGHDYSFQVDFREYWERIVESFKEVIPLFSDQKFAIEYKAREPRGKSAISTVGKTLMIIQELGFDNLGVTIDFGHALQVRENAAETVAILDRYHKLFHVHMNDNTRDWDDDFMVGSYHLMESIEFFYYLKKCHYNGWISLDITPAREDQIGAVEYCIKMMERIEHFVNQLDEEVLTQAFHNHNALHAHEHIMELMFDRSRSNVLHGFNK